MTADYPLQEAREYGGAPARSLIVSSSGGPSPTTRLATGAGTALVGSRVDDPSVAVARQPEAEPAPDVHEAYNRSHGHAEADGYDTGLLSRETCSTAKQTDVMSV